MSCAWFADTPDRMSGKVPHLAELIGGRPSLRQLELAGDLFADSSEEDEEHSEAAIAIGGLRSHIAPREILPAAKRQRPPGASSNKSLRRDVGASPVRAREICITIPPLAQLCEFATCEGGALGRSRAGNDCNRTTLMLQRISYELDEAGVRAILDARGFAGKYNAVYVPEKSSKRANLGYAFVNFEGPDFAALCISTCSGTHFGRADPSRICLVAYSRAQGLAFMSQRIAGGARRSQRAAMCRGHTESHQDRCL